MTVAQSWDELRSSALGCTACPLATSRTNVVFGSGAIDASVMFVGEGPGEREDLSGEPFVGRAGKLLTSLIEEVGLTRESVFIANVVKCRPPSNRNPRPEEIAACRPYLETQIAMIRPKVIVTLGNFATKLLLDTDTGITKLRGQVFPYQPGTVIIPTLHPAAVLRAGGHPLANARADFLLIRRTIAGGEVSEVGA